MNDRMASIDLLRILAMLMVITLHTLSATGILEFSSGNLDTVYEIAWGGEIAAFCAVDCFGLISGYVGDKHRHNYAGIISLWLQVIYYTILFTLFYFIFVPGTFEIKLVFSAIFPVAFDQYWYFTAYFCMSLFVPFLNGLIENLCPKNIKILFCMIIMVCCFFPIVCTRANPGGYTVMWIILLYILGGCIKKGNFFRRFKKITLLVIYFSLVLLTWLSKFIIETLSIKEISFFDIDPMILIDYTSPTVLFGAISLLVIFADMTLPRKIEKIIAKLAPRNFSVYLIHAHPLIWSVVCAKLAAYKSFIANLNPIIFIGGLIASILTIYFVCSIVDILRFEIFRRARIKEMSKRIDKWLRDRCNKLISCWK